MLRSFLTPQFRRFLLTGGVAAGVNIGSRVVFDIWTSYSVAIVLAYACGMATAFSLSQRFVFTDATRTSSEALPRFVVVNLLGVAQTWLVSVALAHALPGLGVVRFSAEIAHLVGVAVPVFSSFIGHRLWTFADAEKSAVDATTGPVQ